MSRSCTASASAFQSRAHLRLKIVVRFLDGQQVLRRRIADGFRDRLLTAVRIVGILPQSENVLNGGAGGAGQRSADGTRDSRRYLG
jgi:hypothetical protein